MRKNTRTYCRRKKGVNAMSIRQTVMMRPMTSGVSGYARVESEGNHTVVQVHARGLSEGEARLFWYMSDRTAKQLASGRVNPKGEISLESEAPNNAVAPERLQALMLLSGDDEPKPLLIGLCAEQSAGSLLDVRNAALALCEKLKKKPEPEPEPAPPSPPAPAVKPVVHEKLPREIFLPAIDPAPYAVAADAPEEKPERKAPSVSRLRALRWPKGFETLQPYFDKALPCALFDLPGWRFVYAAHAGGPNGLWIGVERRDGRVRRVAYAVRGNTPPAPGPYRAQKGLDGMIYQVLWQSV